MSFALTKMQGWLYNPAADHPQTVESVVDTHLKTEGRQMTVKLGYFGT